MLALRQEASSTVTYLNMSTSLYSDPATPVTPVASTTSSTFPYRPLQRPLAMPRSQLDTPPVTPTSPCAQAWHSSTEATIAYTTRDSNATPSKPLAHRPSQSQSSAAHVVPKDCPFEIELCTSAAGVYLEYGRGAWSAVVKATKRQGFGGYGTDSTLISTSTSSNACTTMNKFSTPPTPPRTPRPSNRAVFAVKMAIRRDAATVLRNEALALEHISSCPSANEYVVPYHGVIPSSQQQSNPFIQSNTSAAPQPPSLILTALPLALSSYITDCATYAEAHFTTRTMFDPVVGKWGWLDLAERLVEGLEWLHEVAGVVHGDIKPQNILLRPNPQQHPDSSNDAESDPKLHKYIPVYADFSSAHMLDSTTTTSLSNSLTALTPPYTAPELLTSQALTSPHTIPTFQTDTFSLSLTLIACASGNLNIYPGTERQRLAMAREGWNVLDALDCLRVRKPRRRRSGAASAERGFVERGVEGGIRRESQERWSVGQWREVMRRLRVEEEEKERA